MDGGVSWGCLGVLLNFCVGEVDVCGCSVIGMGGVMDGLIGREKWVWVFYYAFFAVLVIPLCARR